MNAKQNPFSEVYTVWISCVVLARYISIGQTARNVVK